MTFDHMAQAISSMGSLISKLADLKKKQRQARGRERRELESEALEVCHQLLNRYDPSLTYLYLEATGMASADDLRGAWQHQAVKADALAYLRQHDLEGLYQTYWGSYVPDLLLLPPYTFSLHCEITLAQPYLSRDDNAFYIIDNPIVRDRVFRLPLVRPSGWKGNLRAALWQLGHQDGEPLRRLFGEANDEGGGQAGRLSFFPTFFTQTSLAVINPHDRETKVGKGPIPLETVPDGATGTLVLLYVPWERIGREPQETARQTAEDLRLLAAGLAAMLLTYGFSAKRTSGYGLAQDRVADGLLRLRLPLGMGPVETPVAEVTPAPPEPLRKYLIADGQLKPEYLNPDGTFRERSEAELKAMTKSRRQEYVKAKKWWETKQSPADDAPPELPAPEPAALLEERPLERRFELLSELVTVAREVATMLEQGGEG